jgi:hypothetical protein
VYIDPQFFVSASQAQKGRVKLQFKQVSKELYDYLLIYEKYKTDLGALPAGQLASPPGNIQARAGHFWRFRPPGKAVLFRRTLLIFSPKKKFLFRVGVSPETLFY